MNKQRGEKLAALMIIIIVVGVIGFIGYGLLVSFGPRM